ncbi:MAG: EamA family transporter, partial [Candidatus Thorarchaeota archaeon]
SISLFFGLLLAITEGQFNLLSFNIGVLILLLAACLFVFEHTLIKSVFDKQELTPLQAVFIRNFFSGAVLISSYFLFFPIDNIRFLLDSKYYIFYILNALAYGLGLLFYYNTISNMQMGRAIILMSFSPIISAIFSIVLLNEVFSFYHLIGTSIVIFSIYMIIREKQ